jgi:hypothetical protein
LRLRRSPCREYRFSIALMVYDSLHRSSELLVRAAWGMKDTRLQLTVCLSPRKRRCLRSALMLFLI